MGGCKTVFTPASLLQDSISFTVPIMFANMIDFVPSVTHRGISSEDDPIAIGALLFLLSADMVKQ